MDDSEVDADLLDLLTRAALSAEAVLVRIDPGDDSRPTPCPEMTISEVAAHLIGGMRGFTTVANSGELRFDANADPSFAEERPAVLFRAAVDQLLEAFGVQRRIDATYAMPWGPTTGAQLLGFELIETVVHAWDISRGLNATLVVEDDVVGATLAGARQWVNESVRVPGMFGPEIRVDGATPLEELAAFLGRDPAWVP